VCDGAFAVVVEAVADLRRRRHGPGARTPAAELLIAHAGLLARGAQTNAGEAPRPGIAVLRAALRAAAALVDLAVGVVVQTVPADLDGGRRLLDREVRGRPRAPPRRRRRATPRRP